MSNEGQPRIGAGLLAFADVPKAKASPATPAVNNTTPLSVKKPAPVAAPRPAPNREPVAEPAPTVKFPPADASDLDAAWDDFFANNKPSAAAVDHQMLRLQSGGHYKQIIAALRAALINGQAQPWMYDALAASMAIEKYPQDEIERVLLSKTDFGEASFESMLISAAYLVRFGRLDTALDMYRQASRLEPERPEPYILSLDHSAEIKEPSDVLWAACGVLKYDWTSERVADVKSALAALALLEREYNKIGNEQALETLKAARSDAQSSDVEIEVVWSGGDLDLEVEEPSGSVCSITQLQTSGGGYHLGDGYGPRPEDCRETYVCPRGFSGEYRIRVKHSFGNVVGKRATLTITTQKGTPAESKETKAISLQGGDVTMTVRLEKGRRTQQRMVQDATPVRQAITQRPSARSTRRDPNVVPAAAQGGPVGAVGFQPVIQVIGEGAQLGASAIISPDRRYVRMGISPVFSNITDVFTFSVFAGNGNFGGGVGGAGGGGGGQQPNR